MARRDVQPVQKYRQAGSTFVWEVQNLVKDGGGVLHARLIRVGDKTSGKMISVSALKDPRLFHPVDE